MGKRKFSPQPQMRALQSGDSEEDTTLTLGFVSESVQDDFQQLVLVRLVVGFLCQENVVEQAKALVKNWDLSKAMNDDLKKELSDFKNILDPWAAVDHQQVQASKDAIVANQSAVFHKAATLFPNRCPLGRCV